MWSGAQAKLAQLTDPMQENSTADEGALQLAATQREAGWAAYRKGAFGEMRDAFSDAVNTCESIPPPVSTAAKRALANSLRGRAVALNKKGDIAAASLDTSQALQLLAEPDLAAAPGIQRLHEMCVTLQGHLRMHEGTPQYDPAAALQHFQLALAIAQADNRSEIDAAPSQHRLVSGSSGSKLDVTSSLSNIGQAELHLGHYAQAETHLRQVIEGSVVPERLCVAHGSLGSVFRQQGRWLQAMEHWQEALRQARMAGEVDAEAALLAKIARYQRRVPELQGQPSVYADLASALQRLGRTPDAACSICMDEMHLGEGVIVLETCLHAYHSECLEQFWRTRGYGGVTTTNCPMCQP